MSGLEMVQKEIALVFELSGQIGEWKGNWHGYRQKLIIKGVNNRLNGSHVKIPGFF